MSSSSSISFQPSSLGGPSRAGRILGPALDKIIKNASWRKNTALISACKYSLDLLQTISDEENLETNQTQSQHEDETEEEDNNEKKIRKKKKKESYPPLLGIHSSASAVLSPLLLALDPTSFPPKILEPALHCLLRLALASSPPLLCGNIDAADPSSILFRLLDSVCSCTSGSSDAAIELLALRVLIALVRCEALFLHADCLVQVVKSCYNVYLSSASLTNRAIARVTVAQIVTIIFSRVEADTIAISVRKVSVADTLDLSDKNLGDAGLVQAVRAFLDEAMEGGRAGGGDVSSVSESSGELSKIREDGILLYRNLCKFSMKFSGGQEGGDEDPMLLRGKQLSLELLKMVMENAGPIWKTDERSVYHFPCIGS